MDIINTIALISVLVTTTITFFLNRSTNKMVRKVIEIQKRHEA